MTMMTTAPAPLYERIGGRAALERIVPTVVQLHFVNPAIAPRFQHAKKSVDQLTRLAIEFFHTGLSGEATYTGMSMPEAHRGMNISAGEFMAVLDDILAALQQHGVGRAEQAELLYIAYGMKGEIVGR
ncbi:MAG: group 1 truncated hemoglobin [Vicinamibacterales bacterium]